MARAKSTGSKDSTATIGFDIKLWLAADKLRNKIDVAEYKHVVIGLIFLKYISEAFEEFVPTPSLSLSTPWQGNKSLDSHIRRE